MKAQAALAATLAILMASWSSGLAADLLLGVPADEPAPTVAAVLAELRPDGESIRQIAYDDAARMADDLRAGRIDLALMEAPGAPIPGLSAVADLYPSVLHVLHRQPEAPADLTGVLHGGAIWAGLPGGVGWRLGQALGEEISGTDGFTWLTDPWSVEPDVYFIFGGLLTADARMRLRGFRLWSFDAPTRMGYGSVVEGIVLRHPQLRPFVLPAALYPELGTEAALTLAISTVLVTRSAIEASRIYALAAEVERAAPLIAAAYPMAGLLQSFGDHAGARTLGLHEGAQRYRDRHLPTVLERYAEVLALLATLILAGVSGALALRQRRRQTRKDRLDSYYSRALALRQAVDASDGTRREARISLHALQSEVFDLVIAERIDADAALVAFLALSNQLLLELSISGD